MGVFKKILKYGALVLIGLIIIFVLIFYYFASISYDPFKEPVYGVTFSKKFAQQMNLDWKEVYLAMLDDLKVKYVRIPTYWEDIEPEKDQYDFSDIDWQLEQAKARNVKVILVLGRRQPRWPECHDPKWVELETKDEVREEILEMITKVINRYKYYDIIEMWQVENEPFLDFFGECPKLAKWNYNKRLIE